MFHIIIPIFYLNMIWEEIQSKLHLKIILCVEPTISRLLLCSLALFTPFPKRPSPSNSSGEAKYHTVLQWHHNERDSVSNYRRLDCSLNRLFRHRPRKTSRLCVTGLCEGNSPVTYEFPVHRSSYVENVSIWRRHHGMVRCIERAKQCFCNVGGLSEYYML